MTTGLHVTRRDWLIAVLWPSFVLAGIATAIFFSAFDPQQLFPFGVPVAYGRFAAYSAGFFVFWLFSAVSILVGLYLALDNARAEARRSRGGAEHE